MKKIVAVAAVSENWGIGKDGKLLFSIPGDMNHFRRTTAGGIVVMGRKTLESFPNGKPLADRVNIILSKDENYSVEGAVTVHSLDELENELEKYDQPVFSIGGGEIYSLLLPYCNQAIVTKVEVQREADAFFPNLDEDEAWECLAESPRYDYNGSGYKFTIYARKGVRA